MEPRFADDVLREFAFLVEEHGFRLLNATEQEVRFESPSVTVTASYWPNEYQVDVIAALVDGRDMYDRLVLSGMVGRASPARLLEIAAEKLRGNTAVLTGDRAYYEQLGDKERRESQAWTDFWAKEGPDPRPRKLP